MKKLVLVPLYLLATIVVSSCMPAGDPITETFSTQIEETWTLDIELSSSDLIIIVEDRDDLTMTYETFENGPEIKLREGKTLRVVESNDWPFFISFDQSPRLTLYLPIDFNETIKIDTSSGDVDASELLLSQLDIHLSSGDITIDDTQVNDLALDLSSGDVDLTHVVTEFLTIKTSSGDVTLNHIEGEVSGRSSSGDVSVTLADLSNDFAYDLSSGDFDMSILKSPQDMDLNASCSSGDVEVDFDLDDYDRDEDNKIIGRIGPGTYDLDIHTSSGDIEIY